MIRILVVFTLFNFAFIIQTQAQKGELIIIGNVHTPMPKYNSDTLLAILEKVSPDITLLEIDSANFTTDNTFKHNSTENEQSATTK